MNSNLKKLITQNIFHDPNGFKFPFDKIELTRNFIKDSLYNERYGYFSKENIIFNSKTPIPFNQLSNQTEYLMHQREIYSKNPKFRWHTPSEIFNPTYAKIIFEWILRNRETVDDPLVIYEVGGGNGTLRRGILQRSQELLIPIKEYKIIDSNTHSPFVIRKDFLEWDSSLKEERNCFILGMEVLDNLPQDKIRWNGSMLEESYILSKKDDKSDDGESFLELFFPSEDSLIKECVLALLAFPNMEWKSLNRKKIKDYLLNVLPNSIKALIDEHPFSLDKTSLLREIFPHHSEFIPTGPFKMISNIKKFFPNSKVLLSDFHYIQPQNWSEDGGYCRPHNGPIIQGWMDGQKVDCQTHLLKRGEFDIFFAINFEHLLHFWKLNDPGSVGGGGGGGGDGKIWTHPSFIEEFGINLYKECQTKSGYNPLKEEFHNASFISLY